MLWKYTIRYLKNHKKQAMMQIVFIVSMLVMMFGVSIYACFNTASKTIEEEKVNGLWQQMIYNIKDVEKVKDEPHVLEYVVKVDSEDEKIAFLEGDYDKVLSYHLKEGRLARTEQEIVVSQKRLDELNIEPILNTKITLEFGTYTLVGITDYIPSSANQDKYPNYLVCPQAYESINLYLGGQEDEKILNYYNGNGCSWERQPGRFNPYTFSSAESSMFLKYNVYYIGQILVVSILSLILMLNYTYMNLSSRAHDYVLLRGIGALKKQLCGMSLIETIFLFLIALPISIIIALLGVYVLSVKQTIVSFTLMLQPAMLIINVFVGFMIVLIANYIPVSRSIKNALTGEFNAQEFALIEKPKRELRILTFFELAKIKILMHKGRFLFMMIIMVSMMTSIFYGLDIHLDTQMMNQNIEEYLEEPCFKEWHLKGLTQEEMTSNGFTYEIMNSYIADFKQLFTLGITSYIDNPTIYVAPLTEEVIQMTNNYKIKGRLPEKEDEIFLVSQRRLYTGNYIRNIIYINGSNVEINGKTYKVVGQLKPLEYLSRDYYSTDYVNEYEFPFAVDCIAFLSPNQIDDTYEKTLDMSLIQYHGKPIHNPKIKRMIDKALQPIVLSIELLKTREDDVQKDVICIVTVLLMMYFFSQMQKQKQIREDNLKYQSIGVTNAEILKIYFWESMMINGVGAGISILIAIFAFGIQINMTTIVVSMALLTLFTLIYLVPVKKTLKQKGENLWKSF